MRPTPEQREQWREDAENWHAEGYGLQRACGGRIVALLDALTAAERERDAALRGWANDRKLRDHWRERAEQAAAERDTVRTLHGQAVGVAERNAEDAALWRAHHNRTYGAKSGVWVNADGTTTPIEPATTASAEDVDWEKVAERMLHSLMEARARSTRAEAALDEQRERIAQAIEAMPCPGSPPAPLARYAFETAQERAARIAREEWKP